MLSSPFKVLLLPDLRCIRLLHKVSVLRAMANSRGKRAIRRALQEVGLGWLLKTTPQPPPKSFWKKIPATVYAAVGGLALLITLLGGYPWLSIEETGFLDPDNPYSQTFVVSDGGYIRIIDLGILVLFAARTS